MKTLIPICILLSMGCASSTGIVADKGNRQVLVERSGQATAEVDAERTNVIEDAESQQRDGSIVDGAIRYIGANGSPLPFKDDGELIAFLRAARMRFVKVLGGTNRPWKYHLSRGGIEVHGVFHYHHIVERGTKLDTGERINYFRDSYHNQVAAYKLGRVLGIPNIPPTVLRSAKGRRGSLQLFIENTMDERKMAERRQIPPPGTNVKRLKDDMRVFDNLINNTDRNQTNILYDADWQLWYIDHTRAFGRDKKLYRPEKLKKCSRRLWRKLLALDEDQVAVVLQDHVGRRQIASLIARRDLIVERLRERMEAVGAEKVLFDYHDGVK